MFEERRDYVRLDEFVKSLRNGGEVNLDASLLRAPGYALGRVLAGHLAGLFRSDAEIAYGIQTSELAAKPLGWQGATDWYLIVGGHLLYLSVAIAPDPSGGSQATTRHEIRSIDSISKIDIETANVEIGGMAVKESITAILTFTDGKAWEFGTSASRLESGTVRRFVAEITGRVSAA